MSKRKSYNRDHQQKHNTPTLDNEAISNQLEALLTPAIAYGDSRREYRRSKKIL